MLVPEVGSTNEFRNGAQSRILDEAITRLKSHFPAHLRRRCDDGEIEDPLVGAVLYLGELTNAQWADAYPVMNQETTASPIAERLLKLIPSEHMIRTPQKHPRLRDTGKTSNVMASRRYLVEAASRYIEALKQQVSDAPGPDTVAEHPRRENQLHDRLEARAPSRYSTTIAAYHNTDFIDLTGTPEEGNSEAARENEIDGGSESFRGRSVYARGSTSAADRRSPNSSLILGGSDRQIRADPGYVMKATSINQRTQVRLGFLQRSCVPRSDMVFLRSSDRAVCLDAVRRVTSGRQLHLLVTIIPQLWSLKLDDLTAVYCDRGVWIAMMFCTTAARNKAYRLLANTTFLYEGSPITSIQISHFGATARSENDDSSRSSPAEGLAVVQHAFAGSGHDSGSTKGHGAARIDKSRSQRLGTAAIGGYEEDEQEMLGIDSGVEGQNNIRGDDADDHNTGCRPLSVSSEIPASYVRPKSPRVVLPAPKGNKRPTPDDSNRSTRSMSKRRKAGSRRGGSSLGESSRNEQVLPTIEGGQQPETASCDSPTFPPRWPHTPVSTTLSPGSGIRQSTFSFRPVTEIGERESTYQPTESQAVDDSERDSGVDSSQPTPRRQPKSNTQSKSKSKPQARSRAKPTLRQVATPASDDHNNDQSDDHSDDPEDDDDDGAEASLNVVLDKLLTRERRQRKANIAIRRNLKTNTTRGNIMALQELKKTVLGLEQEKEESKTRTAQLRTVSRDQKVEINILKRLLRAKGLSKEDLAQCSEWIHGGMSGRRALESLDRA